MIFDLLNVSLFKSAVRLATPTFYAALGETVSEKAGIMNMGLESLLLSGAFFGFAGAFYSGSLWIGFLCGSTGGVLFSMLHAFISVYLLKDQMVAGVALNLLAAGLTSFLYQLMVNKEGSFMMCPTLKPVAIPLLSKIPIIGEIFFNQDIMVYIVYVLVILIWIFLNKTTWGLAVTSIGEHPLAADTIGIKVNRIKYLCALFNGVLGGIGGAFISLGQTGVFRENISAGRGFIAFAIVLLGRRNPLAVFLATILFNLSDALQFRMQIAGIDFPVQVFTALPYILTLASLVLVARHNVNPEMLGKPYKRGQST